MKLTTRLDNTAKKKVVGQSGSMIRKQRAFFSRAFRTLRIL